MPIDNLGNKHITASDIVEFDQALDTMIEIISKVTMNLTDEERTKYGSIQERNKLFTNAIHDLNNTQPNLSSPDVDWKEYNLDFEDRKFADTRADRLTTLMRMLTDFKIVHDYDNFHAALTDYDYTKYKSGTKSTGYTEKLNYLKQFFAVTTKDDKPTE